MHKINPNDLKITLISVEPLELTISTSPGDTVNALNAAMDIKGSNNVEEFLQDLIDDSVEKVTGEGATENDRIVSIVRQSICQSLKDILESDKA